MNAAFANFVIVGEHAQNLLHAVEGVTPRALCRCTKRGCGWRGGVRRG